jgi:hypothetical protein
LVILETRKFLVFLETTCGAQALKSPTAGIVQPHGCLTVDEILSHFGQRTANAQEKYCEFVQAGIGNPAISNNLQAQSLLGVEGFADGLRHLVREKQ